jgi:hypothetical protein
MVKQTPGPFSAFVIPNQEKLQTVHEKKHAGEVQFGEATE